MNKNDSFTITLRLLNEIKPELERRAKGKGLSLGLYLVDCINRSVHSVTNEPVVSTNQIVHSVYDPAKHNLTMSLPIYDPCLHHPGDKVRIYHYGKWRAATVPDSISDNP